MISIDITNKLFPTWPTIVATLIALLILLLILTKLVYKPVKKMYLARQKYIQDNLDQAKNVLLQSQETEVKAQQELAWAREKAQILLDQAKKSVSEFKTQELMTVKEQAQKVLQTAQEKVKEKQAQFEQSAKQIIVDQAFTIAKTIIQREIDPKIHQRLIDEFISNKFEKTPHSKNHSKKS